MRNNWIIIFLCFWANELAAQKEDYTWTFPNGGGLVFSDTGVVSQFRSSVGGYCEINCSSISDSAGNLLFYCGANGIGGQAQRVFDRNGNLMQNGNSMNGNFNYLHGSMILKLPGSSHIFNIFSMQNNSGFNQHYSRIDLNQNGGLGSVVMRDSMLDANAHIGKSIAIRHANGRDWWVIFQQNSVTGNGGFSKYLLTPEGISFIDNQVIGSDPLYVNAGSILYNSNSGKIVNVGVYGFIDIFDFDRCTGQLSNFIGTGERDSTGLLVQYAYQGAALSPSGRYLYITSSFPNYKDMVQFDLSDPNILSTRTIVHSYPDTGIYGGLSYAFHKIGPDGKIYVSKGEGFPIYRNDSITQSIDVILYPDSPGVACGYAPNYLKLDSGSFTVYGFPHMPDYSVGRDTGSLCDTIFTAVGHQKLEKYITVYPNPSGGVFNFELRQAGDAIRQIKIYTSQGKLLPEQPLCGGTCSTIDMGKQPTGLYHYRCTTTTGKTYTGKLLRE
jgi:hypothetical protein